MFANIIAIRIILLNYELSEFLFTFNHLQERQNNHRKP